MSTTHEVTSRLVDPCNANREHQPEYAYSWVVYAAVLWQRRRLLVRAAGLSLLLGLTVAFTLPKRYKSSGRLMPPSNSSASTAMLAALAGRTPAGLSGLSTFAGALLGGYNSTAVVVELLHSDTIAGRLVERFDLQHVYRKRYRSDATKRLAHHTSILDDKKSGVITVTVDDTDPRRARDLTQAYLDELTLLVNRTSNSAAHQERIFIGNRLAQVEAALEQAQQRLSEFSSTHATVDLKEQTRAAVDVGSRLEAEKIMEQSSLNSLRQMYGDENVRVRASEARVGVLEREIAKLSGSSAPLSTGQGSDSAGEGGTVPQDRNLYPPLRQLPRLAVPYADLYRQVHIQETVFELLTQEYELARIQEAKDTPAVSIIDFPGVPEKKYFPPRLILTVALAGIMMACTAGTVLLQYRWDCLSENDPGKQFARQVAASLRSILQRAADRGAL